MAADDGGAAPGPRVRHTVVVDGAILERAKNTASALAGAPEYLTLGGLIDRALERELARLERKHNDGKSFPKRPKPLRGGRR